MVPFLSIHPDCDSSMDLWRTIDDGRLEDAASKIEQKKFTDCNLAGRTHSKERKRSDHLLLFIYIFSKQAGRFLSQPQEWAKDVHENFHLCLAVKTCMYTLLFRSEI